MGLGYFTNSNYTATADNGDNIILLNMFMILIMSIKTAAL